MNTEDISVLPASAAEPEAPDLYTEPEPEEQPLPKLHTSCKNCVFATWGKPPEGEEENVVELVQLGCTLGRLDEFRRLDPESVIDVFDETGVGFCVVSGRNCNAHRDDRSGWGGDGDLAAKVREEVRTRVAVVVVLHEDASEDSLKEVAAALLRQQNPPEEVFFVNNQTGLSPARINSTLWKAVGNKLTWRIMDMLGKPVPHEQAVAKAVEQAKASSWFVSASSCWAMPDGYLAALDHALNVRMEKFSLASPEDGRDGLAVQLSFYRHPFVGGSEPAEAEENGLTVVLEGIEAKARHMAAVAGKPEMVRDMKDVLMFSETGKDFCVKVARHNGLI